MLHYHGAAFYFRRHQAHLPSHFETSTPETETRGHGRLLSILGVGFGLAVAIGNTIAAGIVRAPGEIATWLPNAVLFVAVWVIGGLYALLGANCLAELGTMIPRSGGQYVYARRALGPYAGFIVGWSDWLSTCGSASTVAFVIGEYLEVLFPVFQGYRVALASLVTIGFAVLQWRGLKWGSRTQEFTSLIKAVAFATLVVACFVLGGEAPRNESAAVAAPKFSLLLGMLLALQAVIYTYDGWAAPIYFSEEVRNPSRNIPRALFGGVLSVMGIYVLLNAALVYVLPIGRIAGNNFALGAAAELIFGARGDTIIRAVMVASMMSGINAYHLMATRVLYAMSRDGLFTSAAARVNPGGTPTISLFASAAVAVVMILLFKTFKGLIAAMSFFFVAQYAMSFVSLFVLRRRDPHAPRPYHTLGHPWTTAAALAGSVVFLAAAIVTDLTLAEPGEQPQRASLYALAILAASYPVYRLSRRWTNSATS